MKLGLRKLGADYLLAGLLGLACSACSTITPDDDHAGLEELTEVVLTDVEDYYLTEVPLGDLAEGGIRALIETSADMTLRRADEELQVAINGEVVSEATFYADDQDSEDTAGALVDMIADLKEHSSTLADHDAEALSSILVPGMLQPLDKFSRYASASEAQRNRENREGFGGIGITIDAHPKGARVRSVTPENPAAAAGLVTGDVILSIDGTSLQGLATKKIAELLRGPIDRPVAISLLRQGLEAPIEISVGRTRIVPNTIFVSHRETTPVIRITGFNQRTAKRLAEAVGDLRSNSPRFEHGLILDLRNNPGGLLNIAVDTADLFLDAGAISSVRGRNPLSHQLFNAEQGDITGRIPVVVLINGATASAAEILASALQDHARAVIVGSVSFGKGTVQTVLTLPNKGELILTWAHFFSPNNHPLHRFGVMPNVCVTGGDNGNSRVVQATRARFEETRADIDQARDRQHATEPDVDAFRALCSWQPDSTGDQPLEAARMLIDNPDLFRRALSLMTGPNVS